MAETVTTVAVIDPRTGAAVARATGLAGATAAEGGTVTLAGRAAEWLAGHLRPGLAVEVLTRDARGRPAAYRGVPAAGDGETFTVTRGGT